MSFPSGIGATKMVEQTPDVPEDDMLKAALDHFRTGIDLLDRIGAPGEIAAYAEVAASQLEEFIKSASAEPHNPQLESVRTRMLS